MKNALNIKSIDGKLTLDEKKIRRYVMNKIIDEQTVFHIEKEKNKVCALLSIDEDYYNEIIESLSTKNVISIGDGNINFIYPVSGFPTNHTVTLGDKRSFHAMCGIDAMGTAYTFKTDVQVNSCCSECGDPINVSLSDGLLKSYSPLEAQVLHVDLDKHDNWSGNCWNIMNFFCTKKHYEQWVEKMGVSKEDIFGLSIPEGHQVAQKLFIVTDI